MEYNVVLGSLNLLFQRIIHFFYFCHIIYTVWDIRQILTKLQAYIVKIGIDYRIEKCSLKSFTIIKYLKSFFFGSKVFKKF